MTLRRFATKHTLAAGAVALLLTAGAGAAVAAATDTFDPKAERDAYQAAVAKKLGVTTQQLEDAYKAAALERLEAAVEAGRITEDQATIMRERIESGELGPMGFGMHGRGMHMRGGAHLTAAAAYLGLDVSSLVEKLRSGSSLADVAKAQGKSVDGLKDAILAEAKTNLDQAVKDGRITDAQRDAALERLTSNLDDIVTRTGSMGRYGDHPEDGFGGGYGGRHGRFGGGFGGLPDA